MNHKNIYLYRPAQEIVPSCAGIPPLRKSNAPSLSELNELPLSKNAAAGTSPVHTPAHCISQQPDNNKRFNIKEKIKAGRRPDKEAIVYMAKRFCVISNVSCRATQSPKRQNVPKPDLPVERRAGIRGGLNNILYRLCLYTAVTIALTAANAAAQSVAIKTNALYLATSTPNLGIEFSTSQVSTINLEAAYNPWNKNNEDLTKYQRLVHLRLEGEYRKWLWESFNGHFFGLHALYADYDISGRNVPFLFKEDYYYKGSAYGLGLSYGFHFMLSTAFGIEANAGLGIMRLSFDKGSCTNCTPAPTHISETYLGPTKVALSLIYLIK